MKKGWKIALISVGSLLGLLVVIVGVALWLVFTPSQLTKIVNNLAGKYVTCETHFGRVNLTLFNTFPDAGLTIDDIYVVNGIDETYCDTVATIGSLTVGVDVKKYLKEKEIIVHQVLLDNVNASLYIDSIGNKNFDIFPHSEKEKDTTKSAFSLDSLPNIDLKKIKVTNLNAALLNKKNNMEAVANGLDLAIVGTLQEGRVDADVNLQVENGICKTTDSTGAVKMDAAFNDMSIGLKAKGNLDNVAGKLKLEIEKGRFNDMVNERLQASKQDLLALTVPFEADLRQMSLHFDESRLKLDDYALDINGDVTLNPTTVDVALATDGSWQVAPLLDIIPEQYVGFRKGMDIDGKVKLQATAVGTLTDSTKPLVNATVGFADGSFYYPKTLPYKVTRINGDMSAKVDLSKRTPSNVTINTLKAHTRGTDVSVKGTVKDLMGDQHINASIKGKLPLEDVKPLLPEKQPLRAEGKADIDLKTDFKMSQLKVKAFDKMKLSGTLMFDKLAVQYDSIHVESPNLNIALRLPAIEHKEKMADVHLTGNHLGLSMKNINADIDRPDINVGVNNLLKEQLSAAVELAVGKSAVGLDSTQIDLSTLALNGSIQLDSTKNGVFNKYNPRLDIGIKGGVVSTSALPETVYLNDFSFNYKPEGCEVRNAEVKLGKSDFQLYGSVENFEDWLIHKKMLVGDMNFVSQYTDVDELMDMFSGKGTDPDSLQQMRQEDKVAKDANPFIVPRDVDLTLHTHIHRSLAFGNDLGDVAGSLTIKDGTAILDQIGFVCKAATMQLTALYKSIRPNNLFCALDFHLLDIQIDELLDMIPVVDTLVPMLAAFNGNADFHLAGEGYLNARYKPKMSTILGSAAITGQNLVVMDNNSIAQIAKLMQFKQWKDKDNKIKIDSLSVEMTCLRKEIEVFPFLLNIGKYQLCASGKHNLDGDCGYHVELLKNPLMAKVGVDVRGSLKKPQITLGEVRYADLYKPDKRGEVEKRTLEMKRKIREALENNVR